MRQLFVLVAAGLASCHFAQAQTEVRQPPNVLFIAVDDLNDWTGCLGGREGVHTRNLDRLAARGVLFTNAHCAAPACNPSRVAVMTGVRPSTSGVYRNAQSWRSAPRLADAVTIPEHFRAAGYTAVGGGKIFHALSWIREGYGKQRNDPGVWDAYFPSKERPMPDALWPAAANVTISENGYVRWDPLASPPGASRGRPPHFFDFAPLAEPEQKMADSKVVDWAVGELGKDHAKPFFLAVGLFRPHIPWFAPKKYFDLYPLDDVFLPKIRENDLDDCPEAALSSVRRDWHKWLVENDQWLRAVQGYLACISFADAQVGRLIKALDGSRHAGNTIVVLWSDHGMHIGEKQHWEKFVGGIDARPADDRRARYDEPRRPLRPAGLASRYLPDAHRAVRPARAGRYRGDQPGRTAPQPVRPPRRAGDHHLGPGQSRDPDRSLALYPLQRRRRRALRPPLRPGRVRQPRPQ